MARLTICPICKSENVEVMGFSKDYNFCFFCKTAWRKITKMSYKANYYKAKSSIASLLFEPIELILYFLRQTYSGVGEKKIWLDVGAGEGNFLKAVSADRKIGVEISETGRRLIQKKGIEAISEKSFLQKNDLNADVISFWHVLEHIDDPLKYLKVAKKNISKRGKVVIGVPNVDSFDFRIFKRHWFHLAPRFHYWLFSPKSIEILLNESGFRVTSVDYFSLEHHLPGVLQSFINWTSGSENVLHGIVKRSASTDKLTLRNTFWVIFWLTVGLPIVLIFWLVSSLFKKPGTFVTVAVPK